MNHPRLYRRLLAVGLAAVALLAASPLSASALEPARAGHRIGIDVSHWQGKINWKRARADGVQFVIAKATEAQSFVDPQYARNHARAEAQGIPFTAYHFARPDKTTNDAIREADHFVRTAKLGGHNLLPVLDLEVSGGLRPARLIKWVQAWLGRVESRLGVKPVIYTSPSFWKDHMGNSTWFANNGYRIWVAHWFVDQPRVPAANWAGRGWTYWQKSNCGRVDGIRGCVDVNLFRGTELARLRITNNR